MKVLLEGTDIAQAVGEYLIRRGIQPKKDGDRWSMKMDHSIVGNSAIYKLTIDVETPPVKPEDGHPYR